MGSVVLFICGFLDLSVTTCRVDIFAGLEPLSVFGSLVVKHRRWVMVMSWGLMGFGFRL